MRIVLFMSFVLSFNLLAETTYSQGTRLNLEIETGTIKSVLKQIETQSDFRFFYNSELAELDREVTGSFNSRNIDEILQSILSGTSVGYRILDNNFVVLSLAEILQQVVITGTVTDEAGEAVPGANVRVEGTLTGVITDAAGKYSITVPDRNAVLVFSFVGYATSEQAVGDRTAINVILAEDAREIDEVVVVGYGTQKKVNLTGSVATVDSKALENRPVQNISTSIQGLLPGVIVMSGSGRPGEDGATIRVRGVGTLNSASPYILIDGVESETIDMLDPNDVENISVLKDAGSAAIYGSKASNGVILITTKRGQTGKPVIRYNGYYGLQKATSMIERLSSAEYAYMYNLALEDSDKAPRFLQEDIDKFEDGSDPYGHPNTDWYGLGYKTGYQHQHNVSVTGGSDNVRYMASAGYRAQNGILPNSERRQFNVRTNLDAKLSSRLNVRANLFYVNNDYKDPDGNYQGGSSETIIRQLNLISPWIPNRNEDGTYGTVSDGNPIAWLDADQTVDRFNQNFTGSLGADYMILDGLKASVQGSYITSIQHFRNFRKYFEYNPTKKTDQNRLDERYTLWNRANFDATLNYDKSFGAHNLKALTGWHVEKFNRSSNNMVRSSFPNNDMTDLSAGDAATQTNSGTTRELAMVSWFGRVNYDYAGKYLAEANIRADASSRFHEDYRWGYFPSFSLGWRISEESFMTNAKKWLNNLKIRASWGLLGNQDAMDDYYPYLNSYAVNGSYMFGAALTPGYYQQSVRNEAITWEEARTWGIGVDATIINRFNVAVDYYDRLTNGINMEVSVPSEFGLGAYRDNVGSMVNRGLELTVGYNDRWNDWTLSVMTNFAYNMNEVLDLGADESHETGRVQYITNSNTQYTRHALGHPFSAFYVYQADGLFASDAEAQAYMDKYSKGAGYPFGTRPFKGGDIKYVDTNGDGLITEADQVYADSYVPKYTFGMSVNVGWKNFDLSMIFSGSAGSTRFFDQELAGDFRGDNSHPATIWRESWTFNQSPDAKMPRIFEASNSNSHQQNVRSTFWLYNTNFVRMKNLQLGYTFPGAWMNAAGLSRLRVYYSAENVFTLSSMPLKADPETTSNRFSSYPLIKTHTIGVNLTF